MKINHLLKVFAGCGLIALASLTASAQTGRLEGDVLKADTKEPIIGAEVQIERTDIKGSYPVKTDKKGHFLHAGVPFVGTYTIIVSAPGCAPDFVQNVKGSQTEPVKFALQNGDGHKLTLADIKGSQSNSASKGGQPASPADQKKAAEEYAKKKAEVEASNKKIIAEHEEMKKHFDAGQQFMSSKDWNGAANEFNEAAKLDAEQQAVWQGLALALYNRGVTSFNAYTKDPANNSSQKDAAKQDFTDSISSINKAIALNDPLLNDPQKGAQAKKSKASFLKSKADAEALLATKLSMTDLIEPSVKDYRDTADISETPADKVKFQLSAARVYFDAGKAPEAVTAYSAIVQSSPDNLDAIYQLGLSYASAAQFQESANTFQQFLDKAPESDARVAEVKTVLKDLVVGNNLQPPKADTSKGKSKKKPQ